MKMDLSIESMQDAVLARAALDGLLGAYARTRHEAPSVIVPKMENDTVVEKVIQDLQTTAQVQQPVAEADTNTTASTGTGDAGTGTAATAEEEQSEADGGAFTKAQIKTAAAQNPTLAALVGKKGRKSEAMQAEIARLTAETLGLPGAAPVQEPVGAALKGVSPEDLATALRANTTVARSEPGVEVRTLPQAASPAAPVAEAVSPIAGDSSLAELLAARRAQQTPPAGTPAPTPPMATETAGQPEKKSLEQMNQAELLQAIREYSDQGAGLFWFRSVVERSKTGDQSKMTAEYMREVLANPDAFYPNAV